MQILAYGIGLIVVTITFHALSSGFMAMAQEKIWGRLETRYNRLATRFFIWIVMSAVIGLFLTSLHGIEIVLWALVYCKTGALNSFPDAVFFSMGSMTTAGASGVTLPQHWRMLGTIESVDGMILFGISTAFIFTMLQFYWRKFVAQNLPK